MESRSSSCKTFLTPNGICKESISMRLPASVLQARGQCACQYQHKCFPFRKIRPEPDGALEWTYIPGGRACGRRDRLGTWKSLEVKGCQPDMLGCVKVCGLRTALLSPRIHYAFWRVCPKLGRVSLLNQRVTPGKAIDLATAFEAS